MTVVVLPRPRLNGLGEEDMVALIQHLYRLAERGFLVEWSREHNQRGEAYLAASISTVMITVMREGGWYAALGPSGRILAAGRELEDVVPALCPLSWRCDPANDV